MVSRQIPPVARYAIAGSLLISGGLMLAGAGGVLRAIYPVMAVALATLLYLRARRVFLDMVLWCWFVTPFIRRVVDQQAGWQEQSIVLLTPYLVSMVAPLVEWRKLLTYPFRSSFPFIAALLAVVYGAIIGLKEQPIRSIGAAVFTWGTPVLFAWWLYTASHQEQRYSAKSLQRATLYGLIVMSLYGFAQFVLVPSWDRNWLTQLGSVADVSSMGVTEPYQLRVFSTLNSAGVLALILASGIVLLNPIKKVMPAVAVALASFCLLLTQGRSGWLCLAVGLCLLFIRYPARVLTMLTVAALVGSALGGVILIGSARDQMQKRIDSVTTVSSDASANDRKRGFAAGLNLVMEHPEGFGLGVPEGIIANDGSFSLHDNGVLEALITLGWAGGVIFLGAPLLLIFSWHDSDDSMSEFRWIARIVGIALWSQLIFGSVFLSVSGFLLWSLLSFSSSSPKYIESASQALSEKSEILEVV